MSEHPGSSTERRHSLREETDEAICESFLRRLRQNENPDVDELLLGIDEPRRSQLKTKLRLCRDSYDHSPSSPSDETTDWSADSADSAAADVSGGYETIECLGRYRIQRPLGRGTYGQVFLALDGQLDRLVAIKTPRANRVGGVHDIEKFQNEARILAKLDHPAIVPVYDVGMTDTHRCYVVSKFIDGDDLAHRIGQERPTFVQAARWMAVIAEALHHSHTRKLVHRDVKPGNILLDKEDNPYLADFGLALREEDFGRGAPYAGTVYYMSPEQARGEGHRVDGRSDVFSLGVVLYLLLTGQRPFSGVDKVEILERIATREVRAPRQENERVPKELERICLHALAKRASDRYATAREMADDLQHFLADCGDFPDQAEGGAFPSDVDSMTNIQPIMPKGLRSFDSQDADFFLALLPGPYDRHGLPQVVRFWKRQIEHMGSDETFRVGLICGPSGCGKSSLVKAGILPNLTPNVRSVILEATSNDTEATLLSAIRKRCPDVDQQVDLTDTLTEIRRGAGLPEGEKLLIIVDQCEQWLHAHQAYSETALCHALRQCDGQRAQCILLVRDDFWMSATRFMRDLEIQIVEGENSTVVDLFDKRHARRVLSAFGRAYDALPNRASEMTADQKRFLGLAVDELAHEGKVISVQLVLFAEMVKDKPWTPETLRRVGGIQGIGVTFLEEAFDSATATPEHRLHQIEARAVLASLLPEHGTDIKGHTQTHDQLFAVSGCANQDDFDDLMRILNAELRLLTPAESRQNSSASDQGTSEEMCYQLAHDYLVPALRQWLTRKQRETRPGRAGLLLTERAEFWHAKPERKQLPSFLEWLYIVRYVRRRDANEMQRKMMAIATRNHLVKTCLVILLLFVAVWGVVQFYRYEHSANLVARLMDAEPAGIPTVILDMEPYRGWVDGLLQDADAGDDPDRELALRLAKRPLDQEDIAYLRERMLIGAPDQIRVIRDVLTSEVATLAPLSAELWAVLEDTNSAQYQRFRASCALAVFDPDSDRWKAIDAQVAAWLVAENPVVLKQWSGLLRPVSRQLEEPLKVLFQDDQDVLRLNAATVLAEYLEHDVAQFVPLNRTSDVAQRRIMVDALREHRDQQAVIDLLQEELARTAKSDAGDDQKAVLALQRASAATMLMLLDEPDEVWPLLVQGPDPQVRTSLLHGIARARIEPDMLIERLVKEQHVSLKIGLLLSLAEYKPTSLSHRHRTRLVPVLLALFEKDPHAGVHSASECLLRRLGHVREIEDLNRQLQTRDPVEGRDWYVASSGDTMTVLRDPAPFVMGTRRGENGWVADENAQEKHIGRSYAIATKEVTYQQFRVMWADFRRQAQGDNDLDHPLGWVEFDTMMGYCLWLSESQGIQAEQCCYERMDDGTHRAYPDILSRTGYRLPTEYEWEYACRAGTTTLRHDGYGTKFLSSVAWYRGVNDDGVTKAVGMLLPNEWGMFDVYGNVNEFCQNIYSDTYTEDCSPKTPTAFRPVRGGSYIAEAIHLRSARRYGLHPGTGSQGLGFRIARTIYNQESINTKGEP